MDTDGRMQVSPEAVQQMIDALRQYQARVDATVSDVTRTVGARFQSLNRTRDEAQLELHRWQDELFACDANDDREHLQSRLDRAQERLDRIDRLIEESAEALVHFKRSRAEIQDCVSRGVPRAVGYLEEKHKELIEYLSLAFPGEYGAYVNVRTPVATSTPRLDSTQPLVEDMTVLALPPGFQWVRVDDISKADDLRPEERFSKVTAEEVESGFRILKQEVLPALQVDPARSADFFRQCDSESNRVYANGALRVYEAFFGESHIALTHHPVEGTIGVTNGRHRIQVARRLGWTSVPARFI